MPDGEQRAGQSGERTEVDFAQRSGEAGVLHADFNRQCAAGGFIKAEQFPAPVAAKQANGVMQNNGDNYHKADRRYVRRRTCHNSADDGQDAHHRKRGQIRFYGFYDAWEQMVNDQAQSNRNNHDLQNAQQHTHHIYLNMRVDVKTGEQRCGDNTDQR